MSDWKTVPLSALVENLDSRRVPVKRGDRQAGKYPYYGASGIVDWVDGYLFEGEHLLVAEDGENLNSRNLPVAFRANGRFWVNNHAHILKGPNHLLRFLEHYLNSLDVAGWVTGSAQPKLTQGNLNSIPVTLPSDDEELKAIARVLGALDDKIELNRRMNRTLEGLAATLFRSWFVDFDPVVAKAARRPPAHLHPDVAALFPDAFQDSPVGPIPHGWNIESIYTAADVIYGAPFASGKFNSAGIGKPLIRIRDLPDDKSNTFTPEEHPKGYLVCPGDIVVGMDGEFRAYLWGGEESWLNQRLCVCRPKPGFSAPFVRCSVTAPLAEVEATELATTVIHLGKQDIDRFQFVCPPPEVLARFNEISQPWYNQIVHNRRESRTLSALRDTLFPKLLSGELRVKAAEKILERHNAEPRHRIAV
jgi:type I restriction enzyme S subunit